MASSVNGTEAVEVHTFCSSSQNHKLNGFVLSARTNRQTLTSDDELLRRIASGDKQSFLGLYDRYRERLFTYCCRMIGDRERAKDAMQESLLKAYQNAGMYQDGTNVAAWLFRLTRNVCIDMIRARKEHDTIDDLQLPVPEHTPDVMLQDALTGEIERLPAIYREAVILRDVQGHSYDEIAKITGTAISTVKFRIFKARDTLRQRLALYLQDQ
ncbi:MAG TPA: sigma-70 family RNA polymerase sigma factor [Candidatus Kapabacteria bacterium]|nr:sigma-70 family RNA polymerase sigma factor [Candidatus Kapabacteria bacterium]